MNKELYERDPRDYTLQLAEDGLVSADHLLTCAPQWMSADQVRGMLDANELSPRFDYSNEDEGGEGEEE